MVGEWKYTLTLSHYSLFRKEKRREGKKRVNRGYECVIDREGESRGDRQRQTDRERQTDRKRQPGQQTEKV